MLAVPFNNSFRRLVVEPPPDPGHAQPPARATCAPRLRRVPLHARARCAAFLTAAGFETLATYPNDLRPPKVMGLWVDCDNLFEPAPATRAEASSSSSPAGRAGSRARSTLVPWLVCGEATFVARAV